MLLAQESQLVSGISVLALVGLLAAIGVVLFAIVLLVLLLRHTRANRELLHTERLRSIEAGFPLEPPDPMKIQNAYMHNAFWISFWIVFGVPGAAFSGAVAATKAVGGSLPSVIVIWIGASAASIAAVVTATILMIHSRGCQRK